jgi:hypothetical protein
VNTTPPQKIDLGTQTEDDVQRFVEHSFSADFVFRSPQHLKGGLQKETTDVFVLFDDVAMPIQVKAQAYNADGSPREDDPNWTKRNLEKAVSQLKGAVRTIKAGQIVRLENNRRGAVQFSADMFRYVYGLVVLNHVSAPFDPVELVPEIADLGVPVHVLSFVDFYNLNRILDTPADLIEYFESRADVLIPTFHPKVHEEQAVFDYYIEHFEEVVSLRAKHHGDDISPDVFKHNGEVLRRIYRGDYAEELKASRFVDKIIDRTHQVDPSAPSPFEGGERDYVPIATYLGSLPRSRRAIYGKAFLDAIKRAGDTNDEAFAHFSSAHRSECLLFLASPRPREKRKERNTELHQLLWLLKATRQVRRAMGIVTEAGFGKGRSYDFVLIESDPQDVTSRPDYDEIKHHGEALFSVTTPR